MPRLGEIAPRQQRPTLFGGTDALAGLQQQRRIKTPQRGLVIVERHHGTQAHSLTHRIQPRCRHICTALCIRHKKQRLFSQLTRYILLALDMGGIFRQQAGGGALDIHVCWQQPVLDGFHEGGRLLPERTLIRLTATDGNCCAQILQMGSGHRMLGLDDMQDVMVEFGLHRGCIWQQFRRNGRNRDTARGVQRHFPQISRMNALGSRQFFDIAVLRKQRHGTDGFAVEDSLQIINQGETRLFNFPDGHLSAGNGAAQKTLDSRFHGTNDECRSVKAHHVQGTDNLVQLRPGHPQGSGIDGRQIGPPGSGCFC